MPTSVRNPRDCREGNSETGSAARDLTSAAVTAEEAARFLRLSRSTVYHASACGDTATVRIGRTLIVVTAKLLEMVGLAVPRRPPSRDAKPPRGRCRYPSRQRVPSGENWQEIDPLARRMWRVGRHEDGWQVKRDGATRATRTFSRKHDAVQAATSLDRGNPPSRLIVHRPDGTVLRHADYGEPGILSCAGVFEGPPDLGVQSEKYLAEHFSGSESGP